MDSRTLTLKPVALAKFREALLSWYDQHRRDLPWRRDSDPYGVWISEIMLQQTRVEAVRERYVHFRKRFPTMQRLAAAREESVLALWSGLGYYHRARRMHQVARIIVRERKGVFPQTAEEWLQLPGIGRYTAAAVASISFGEPIAVVDGNVERVLARIFASARPASASTVSANVPIATRGKNATWQQAQQLLDPARPGEFNQAMMELGATICTPRAPQCLLCPVYDWCAMRGEGAARTQARRKRKQLRYVLARNNGSVLLVQRATDASLMAGMWELPTAPDSLRVSPAASAKFRHSITDTDYEVSVLEIPSDEMPNSQSGGRWLRRRQWERLPLTGLARKILARMSS